MALMIRTWAITHLFFESLDLQLLRASTALKKQFHIVETI